MKPRDYQTNAEVAVHHEWETAVATAVVLPTGTGKTVLFANIIKSRLPGRALVLAHREELIWQAREKIQRFAGVECAIEMADLYANSTLFGEQPVVISTVQTQNSAWGDRKRMGRFKPTDFDTLIIDECHHSTAKSYRSVIDYYSQNPKLKVLGVTATPDRADEEALGQIFSTVAYDYEILDAINDGWLVPIDQQFVSVAGLDFSEMRTTAGDLNGADLAAVMESERNMQGVTGAAIQIIGNKRAILFTCSVKQAEQASEIFNRYRPGMADWVCGMTNKDERRSKLSNFKTGQIQVMCNCGVLTEGFDDPGVEVIIMGRPTKSRSLYAQMAGRGTRPLDGIVDGLENKEARIASIQSSTKPSCIASGQRVLTDVGEIPIEQVTTDMKVWDGIEFVSHCGILFRGKKKVINYAGLIATADHRVWTQEGWQTFGKCAAEQIPICDTGAGGAPVWEAVGRFRYDSQKREGKALCRDGVLVRQAQLQGRDQHPSGLGRLPDLWSASPLSKVAVGTVREREDEMRQYHKQPISGLRWSWHQVQLPFGKCHGAVDSGTSGRASGIDSGPHQQRRKLRTWKPPLGDELPAAVQSEGELESETWDLLNCGPRHQFTVEGLLVSNCLIIDFVGNSGRHKLMSSADILGGKVSDKAIENAILKAKKDGGAVRMDAALSEEEQKLKEKIEAARQAAEQRKVRLVAKVQYSAKSINPFDAFDIQPIKQRGWDSGKTLSEKQANLLMKQGINPDKLTYTEGRQVLSEMFRRWDQKLCTVKQAALLKKHGYETKNLKMETATQLITSMKNNGWRRAAAPVVAPVAIETQPVTADIERSPFE